MKSLRDKQQDVRNEKLNRLRKQLNSDSENNTLKVKHEFNRITSNVHDKKSEMVKQLINKRVEEFKVNQDRWSNNISTGVKESRFQERDGNNSFESMKLLLEKILEKLQSGTDYFITEDITKLKKIVFEKLYLLSMNQIETIQAEFTSILDVSLTVFDELRPFSKTEKLESLTHIFNLVRYIQIIISQFTQQFRSFNNMDEKKKYLNNIIKIAHSTSFVNAQDNIHIIRPKVLPRVLKPSHEEGERKEEASIEQAPNDDDNQPESIQETTFRAVSPVQPPTLQEPPQETIVEPQVWPEDEQAELPIYEQQNVPLRGRVKGRRDRGIAGKEALQALQPTALPTSSVGLEVIPDPPAGWVSSITNLFKPKPKQSTLSEYRFDAEEPTNEYATVVERQPSPIMAYQSPNLTRQQQAISAPVSLLRNFEEFEARQQAIPTPSVSASQETVVHHPQLPKPVAHKPSTRSAPEETRVFRNSYYIPKEFNEDWTQEELKSQFKQFDLTDPANPKKQLPWQGKSFSLEKARRAVREQVYKMK